MFKRILFPLFTLALVIGYAAPVAAVPPLPVTPLTVTVNGTTITATWGASATAIDYEVILTGPTTDSRVTTETSLSFTNVLAGDYTVGVDARNADGSVGPVTQLATVVAAAPSVPTNVVASVSGQTVSVVWGAPVSNGGDPALFYTVALDGGTPVAGSGGAASFSNVAAGPHSVTVTVSNSAGSASAESNSVTVAAPVTVPGVPTNVSASVSGQTVSVSWGAPVSNGGSPVLDYTVSVGGSSQTVTGTSVSFPGLAAGSYTASVTARNSAGAGAAGTSNSVTVAAPVTVPGVPTNVSASVSGQTVSVSWGAPVSNGGSPVLDYTVSVGGSSQTVTGTSVSFPGLAAGSYTASVTARNSAGAGAAGTSNSVTVAAPVTVPGVPTNVSASVSGQTVSVSWGAPVSNGGSPVLDYTVSVGGSSQTVTGTSVSFPGLAAGSYTASVTARNSAGAGAAGTSNSVTVAAPVTVPGVPTNVSASVSGQTVSVSWGAPVSNGGSPVLDYTVSVGGSSQTVTGTSVSFPGLAAGSYTASVTARNSAGAGAAGTSNSVTVAAPVTVPGVPTNVSASASGQSVTVSWGAPVSNGGDPAISYSVSFGGESGSTVGTSLTFNNVTPGTYTASVTASNTGGTSGAGQSGSFIVTAPIGTPGAPQGATAGVVGQTVNVSWAAPADDGGDPNITYEITLGGLAPLSTTGTSVSFTNVLAGSYTATITASNSAGEGGTATSGSVTVAAPVSLPGVPTGFGASLTPNGQGVTIGFAPPSSNGGSPITGYIISRTGTSSDSFTTTSLSELITGLAPGTYSFTVAAVNSAGTGPGTAPDTVTIVAPVTLPGIPGPVIASVSGQTITVNWSAPSNGGDPNLNYTISIPGAGTKTTSSTSIEFFSVPAGNYTASVTATNSAGTGGAGISNSVSVFTLPGKVGNLSAGAEGSSIIVVWNAPVATGNRPLTGYEVRLEQNGAVLATQNVGGATTGARFDGRSPGTYRVVVSAKNDQGTGPDAGVDVNVGSTTPSAPANVSATAAFQTVTVTWDPPLTVGNTALSGYRVNIGAITQTVGAGTRSVVFSSVPEGSYVAQVWAINSGGEGIPGESESFITETVYAPFSTAADLISRQYLDFLGRPADAQGLAYWESVLGANRSQGPVVIQNFMRSKEFAPRRSIARLYLAFFDRAPDRNGFDYWTGTLAQGASLGDVAAVFAGSPEFKATYGELNDAEFIALVYNNVLLRSPDLTGFRFWIGRLQDPSISRGDLMVAFSESPEFVRNSNPAVDVIMTYRGMLDRAPDPSGFSYWVGQVGGKPDALKVLIANFMVSQEYYNRVR